MKIKTAASSMFKDFRFTSFVLIVLITSCNKQDIVPQPPPKDTSVVIAPTPTDTISYIKRLEEYYVHNNPTQTTHTRDYSFYYDNSKRLINVGIKSYNQPAFDTTTCRLFYSGNSLKPYMIITFNKIASFTISSEYYDTTYFKYNSNNQLVADSGYEGLYVQSSASFIKKPLKRYYNYQGVTQSTVDWYGFSDPDGSLEIIRQDTLDYTAEFQLKKIKTQFYISGSVPWYYAETNAFAPSNYINPLSRLNISGTIFSLIYTSVKQEVLGNSNHKAVTTQNILPYYLDFFSSKIPSTFFLGGYTSSGYVLAGGADAFDIRIEPWSQRSSYPSQISVGASTALGDRVVYRYYYY